LRGKGITYDTGFINNVGIYTRENFDYETVQQEMRIIRDDLCCNAVRITGGNPDRLETAATCAAKVGLEVWFCPFTCDLTIEEMRGFLADCSERAEKLRRQGAEVVFITGSELSLFTVGFLPGRTLKERIEFFMDPSRLMAELPGLPARINDFLGEAVKIVRAHFRGKISYASLPFEGVDWSLFDFISTDAGYRSVEVAGHFANSIAALVSLGKPVAITEFGCTTFRGATNLGGRGDSIIEWGEDGRPVCLNGDYVRDEDEQAGYLIDLLDIFESKGVDTVFVNTFARYDLPHRLDSRLDLDRASYGVVKVLEDRMGYSYPEMPWEPKEAFKTLAAYYRDL